MQRPLSVLVALLSLFLAGSVGAITLPEGFENTQVLGSLDSPAGMAFAPDGRLFVAERITGRLRIAERPTSGDVWTLRADPFYSFDIPVDGNGDPERHRSSGLRGFAFDPDYAQNGYLYAFYMRHNPRHNRVVRIQADPTDPNRALPGSEVLLLDLPFNATGSSGSHNGGGIEVGADGKLYVTTGDGWSGGDDVQSLQSFTGKVLRIETDGAIPTDNPFYAQATGDYRAIFGLGLRNPFSISREPSTGDIFVNDVSGSGKADIFRAAPGANYGHQGFDGIGTETAPFADGAMPGGKVITGGAWYPTAGSFPAEYHGNYFVTLWGSNSGDPGEIHRLLGVAQPTAAGFATDVLVGDAKPVLARIDPLSGDLFYMLTTYETGAASIHRIRWTGQSTAEAPTISPDGGTFDDPVVVTLSTSAAGATIHYTLDGAEPTDASPTYVGPITVSQSGTLRARAYAPPLLPSGVAAATFQIGAAPNLPPVALAGPDQRVALGTGFTLNGSASFDPDGDDELLDQSWTQIAGPSLSFPPEDVVVLLSPTQLGTYAFELRVDDGQASDVDPVTVEVVDCVDDVTGGLVARWSFDEGAGTLALDSGDNAFHGSLGGPAWSGEATDESAGSLDFDGVDDRVDLGTFDLGGGALTIAFWFRADDFGQMDGRFLSKASGVQDGDHLFMVSTLQVGGEHRLRFRLRTSGATSTLIAESGDLQAGAWTHAAAVYDGQQMRLYQDGQLVGTLAETGALATDPAVPVAIGNQPQGSRPFDGLIDEMRIYDRALEPEELDVLRTRQGICGVVFADGFESGGATGWSSATAREAAEREP